MEVGHLGVAEGSRRMGSVEVEWSAETVTEESCTEQSSTSAFRLRVREWNGRDSWARSSMRKGEEKDDGGTGRNAREGPVLGREDTW